MSIYKTNICLDFSNVALLFARGEERAAHTETNIFIFPFHVNGDLH